jgi:hypothetical protein
MTGQARLCAQANRRTTVEEGSLPFDSFVEASVKLNQRAPQGLPRAVSDLIAEGGNTLASDDAPVGHRAIARGGIRRFHLSDTGRWIARVRKA